MPLKITDDFGWNENAGRYVNITTGRFVSYRDVAAALELQLATSQGNMTLITEQLRDGSLNLAQWQLSMEREIKTIHTISGALARGGWAQMTQSDWGWVGQRVRTQYEYLRNFANQIADGTQPLNGRAVLRAKMYAQAARTTYQEMRRRYMRIYKGAAFESRHRTPGAESCEGGDGRPGCIELEALGIQPVGVLTPLGNAQCLTFCKCYFRYYDENRKRLVG